MLPVQLSKNWFFLLPIVMVVGCALVEEPPKKTAPFGLITTPASYYSTPKARYLGGKYRENLDRLVDRIVRTPKTSHLQFANNIASVGGIGFFTHSAARTPDERYLEVVLGAPETFETKGDYSAKVQRLFTLYGTELLSILAGDSEIYQEKEVAGYGLNLSWRNMASDPSGPRVITERAVAYFPKDKVRGFLRHEIDQNKFLSEAVIFAVEENGPMNLVSYRPQEVKPDSRPQIREENLAVAKAEPEPEPTVSPSKSAVAMDEVSTSKASADKAHDEPRDSRAKPAPNVPPALPAEKKPEIQPSAPLPDMTNAAITTPAPDIVPPKQAKSQEQKVSQPVEGDRSKDTKTEAEKASEKTAEALPTVPAVAKTPDKAERQKPELSSDTSVGPGVGKAGLSKVPTKSDEQKVEASKTVELAPEKVTPAQVAPPIAQKPVEKAKEPGPEPQKAMETKTNVAAAPLAPTTKTADLEPPPSRAVPEVTVEPVAKSLKATETKANIPVEPAGTRSKATDAAPVVNQTAEAKKPGKTGEHSVTPQKTEKALTPLVPSKQDSAHEPRVGEPVKGDRSSDTKTLSEKPSEKKPEVLPTVPAVAKTPDNAAPQKPELSSDTSPGPGVGKAELSRVPTKSDEQKVETSKAADVAPEKITSAKTAPPPAQKSVEKAREPVVKPQEAVEAKTNVAPGGPTATPKATDIAPVVSQASEAKLPVTSQKTEKVSKAEPAKTVIQPVETKKVEPLVAAPRREVKTSDMTAGEQVVAREKAPRTLEQSRLIEEKKSDAAPTQAKLEARIPPAMKTAPIASAPSPQEKPPENSTGERLALLKKPIESVPEKKPLAPPAPKALEGFIIQVAFNDRVSAQRWAETFGRRGYAVSVTEASAGSLRVRIGNFAVRDEAERQLRTIREQGLTGIIINLPQAYRPDVRPPAGEESGKTLSGTP